MSATLLDADQPLTMTDSTPTSGIAPYSWQWIVNVNGGAWRLATECATDSGTGAAANILETCDIPGSTLQTGATYSFEFEVEDTNPYVVGSVPTANYPLGVAYDQGTGNFYVANSAGSVDVIAGSTGAVVDSFLTYASPNMALYDPATHEIFLSDSQNQVQVVSDRTNTIVETIPVGALPFGMAYDSGHEEIFVANSNSNNVTVIDETNDHVVANINVGGYPYAVAYDPAVGEVFVANVLSSSISVINDTTDQVVGTIDVSAYGFPYGLAYDNGTQEIFATAEGPTDYALVINPANLLVLAHVPVGVNPVGLAYDSGTRQVYVVNEQSGTVSVINDVLDEVVATLRVGAFPYEVAYNPASGDLLVANSGSANVTLLSDGTQLLSLTDPSQGGGPIGVAYDSGKGEVFVSNDGSNTVSVLSATTGQALDTIGVGGNPWGLAYDSGRGEVFVANNNDDTVSVINDSTNDVVATIDVGNQPLEVAYDSAIGEVFVSNYGDGTVSVIDDLTNLVVGTIYVGGYPVGLAYDSGTNEVYVADGGSGYVLAIDPSLQEAVADTYLGGDPTGVAYDPTAGTILAVNGADLSVISDVTNKVVASVVVGYNPFAITYDTGTGDAYISDDTGVGAIYVVSMTTNAWIGTFTTGSFPWDLAYDEQNGTIWTSIYYGNSLSVIADQAISLAVSSASPDVAVSAPLTNPDSPSVNATVLDGDQQLNVSGDIPTSGSPTFSWQWLISVDDAPYANATQCVLNGGNLDAAGMPVTCLIEGNTLTAGYTYSFELEVSDSATSPESATSEASPLVTVNTPLGAPTTPVNSAIFLDDDQALTVTSTIGTSGTAPYSWQWYYSAHFGPWTPTSFCSTNSGTNNPGNDEVECSIPGGSLDAYDGTWVQFALEVVDSASNPENATSASSALVHVAPALTAPPLPAVSATKLDEDQPFEVLSTIPYTGTGTDGGGMSWQWLVSQNGSAYFPVPVGGCSGVGYQGTVVSCSVPGNDIPYPFYYNFELQVNDSADVPETNVSSPSPTVYVNGTLQGGDFTPILDTIDLGQSATLYPNPIGGFSTFTYEWFAGSSSNCSDDAPYLSAPPGPPHGPGHLSPLVVSPTKSTWYCYIVTDSANVSETNRSFSADLVKVYPALGGATLWAANPELDVNQTILLLANETGGTGSYTYAWAGLPSGCVSGDTGALGCEPTQAGNFLVTVWVNDTNGASSMATLWVYVNPDPTITAPMTYYAVLDVGESLDLWTYSTYGYGLTASYSWSGLPEGCTSVSDTDLSCDPDEPGTYVITVSILDSDGYNVTSGALLVTIYPWFNGGDLNASTTSVDVGQTVVLEISLATAGGSGVYTIDWFDLPAGCTGLNSTLLYCAPNASAVGLDVVEAEVIDSTGWGVDTNVLYLTVSPDPTVTSPTATPWTIDSGQSTSLSTSVSYGSGLWVLLVWNGLPEGCTTVNLTVISCTPSVASGSYSIWVTAVDSNGFNVSSGSSLLVIDPALARPSISGSRTNLDVGQSLWFFAVASGGSGTYAYAWQGLPSGCVTVNTSTLSCTPNAVGSGSFSVTVEVTDSNGAEATSHAYVLLVKADPTVTTPSATLRDLDVGETTTLTSTSTLGSGLSASYSWTGLPTGCGSTNALSVHCTPTATGTYSISITILDSNGFSVTSATVTLVISPALPAPTLSASVATLDVGQTVVLYASASGGTGAFTYSWGPLPTGCSSSDLATLTCVPTAVGAGTFSVTVTVQDTNGVSNTSLPSVLTIFSDPTVTLPTSSLMDLDVGQTTQFTTYFSQGSGGGPGFVWSGLPSNCNSPDSAAFLCSPMSVGTYTVSVSLTDSNGFTATAGPVTIVVSPALATPTLSVSVAALDVGQSVLLYATASGGTGSYTYAWSTLPTGCSSSNLATLTCVPTAVGAGTFAVTVTVTDSNGVAMNSLAVDLTISPDPTITAPTATARNLDIGQSTTLSTTVTIGAGLSASYAWHGLPAGCSSAAVSFLCDPSAVGTYTVIASVTDSNGFTVASSTVTLVVSATLALPTLTGSVSALDVGQTVVLSATASGGTGSYTYAWGTLPTGCFSSNLATLSCVPTAVGAGTYGVTVTVTDTNGVAKNSLAVTLTISADPTITTPVAAPMDLDVGQTTNLSSTSTVGSGTPVYAWNGLPVGCSDHGLAFNCHPAATGTYTVSVSITDSNGFTATSAAVSIVISPALATPTFTASAYKVDVGQTVTLVSSVSGGTGTYAYVWNNLPFGCLIDTTATVACAPTAVGAGSYAITVTVTDSNGAVETSLSATVDVYADPTTSTPTATPNVLDLGQSTTLATSSTVGAPGSPTYWWAGLPAGCSSGGLNFVCRPSATGTYTISVSVRDTLGFNVSSSSVTITVSPALGTPSLSSSRAATDVGQSLTLTTQVTGGTGLYSYAWTGLPAGCASSDSASLVCVPTSVGVGSYTPSVTVTDTNGAMTSAGLGSALSLYPAVAITALTPSAWYLDLGQGVYYSVSASGGHGAYEYVWSGLPDGCSSSDVPVLYCVPTTTGGFTVSVSVTDANGFVTTSEVDTFVTATAVGSLPQYPVYDPSNGLVYVPNCGSDNVSVLYGSDSQVDTTIDVGSCPLYAVLDPANGDLYVPNFGSNDVSVIDTSTNTVVATVPVGTGPIWAALDTGNGNLYVVNEESSAIAVIDGATNLVTDTIPVGPYSYVSIVYDSWNGYLYASSYTSDNVTVLDGATNTIVASIALPGVAGYGMAFDPSNGNIYVANNIGDNVSVIDGSSNSLVGSVTVGSQPDAVNYDSLNGYLYVSNCGSDDLTILGGSSNVLGSVSAAGCPTGLDVNATNGLLYEAAFSAGEVLTFQGLSPAYLNVSPALALSPVSVSMGSADVGQTVNFSVRTSSGDGGYAFSWSLPAGLGCAAPTYPTSYTSVVTCTVVTPGIYLVSASVSDYNGENAMTPLLSFTVYGDVFVGAPSPSAPAADVGQTVTFTTSTVGGTGTYSYSWSGLPSAGCSGMTSDTVICTWLTAGNYLVGTTVNDSNGYSVFVTVATAYVVSADPTIGTPTATPSTLDVGLTTQILVSATNGTGLASTYAWYGLPTGCASTSALLLPCSPSVAGTFSISVSITDSNGYRVLSGPLSLVISPALGTPGLSASVAGLDLGQTAVYYATASGGTGIYTYAWSNLPLGCSSANTATLTCSPTAVGPGTYLATVTVTDSNSVSSTSASVSVTVSPDPTISTPSATKMNLDVGESTTLSASSTVGAGLVPTYAWWGLPAGCASANALSIPCSPTATGAYTVHVTVTDSNGYAVSSGTVTLVVSAALGAPTLSASLSTLDVGQTVTLATLASGGTGIYTYVYSGLPAGCVSANVATLSCIPSAAGTGHFSVTVTDSNGVANPSAALTLTVSADPSVTTPTATLMDLDVGETTVLATVAGTGSGTPSYVWNGLPAGCTSLDATSLSCSPTSAGTYSVSVSVTDSNGVTATSGPISLVVSPGLGAPTLTASVSALDVGQSVVLATTVSGGTGSYTYVWTGLPAGCVSTNLATVSCTPTSVGTGTYSVSVTVTDTNSVSVTSSAVALRVSADPTIATPTASRTALDVGQTVALATSGTNGTGGTSTYAWSGLPTSCASLDKFLLSCTPGAPGTFNVRVAITDSNGVVVSSGFLALVVSPALTVPVVSASRSVLDVGQTVVLSASFQGGSGGNTYTWKNLPDGCFALDATSLTCSPTAVGAGSYAVSFNVTDSNLAWTTSGTAFTVVAQPALSTPWASPASVDVGQTTSLMVTATNGSVAWVSYAWSGLPSGCATANATTVSCTPAAAGTFEITVTMADANGYRLTSGALALVVVPALRAPTLSGSATALDVGQTVTFSVSVLGGAAPYGYAWLGLPTGCVGGNSPTVSCSPNLAGSAKVSVNVTDANGVFWVSNLVTVDVTSELTAGTVTLFPSSIDLGQSTQFGATVNGGSGNLTYAWSGLPAGCSGTTTSTPSCTPSVAGSYWISVDVTDSNGETVSVGPATLTVSITLAQPTVVASASSVQVGGTLTFSAAVSGGTAPYSFSWGGLPGGCASQDSATISCVTTAAGIYHPDVHVTDGAGVTTNSTLGTVTVTSAPAQSFASGANGLEWTLLVVVLVLGLVVANLLVLLYLMRKRGGGKGQAGEKSESPAKDDEDETSSGTSPETSHEAWKENDEDA